MRRHAVHVRTQRRVFNSAMAIGCHRIGSASFAELFGLHSVALTPAVSPGAQELECRTSHFGRRNRHGSGHDQRLAGFLADSGKDEAVAVPEMALYPTVFYSIINSSLEITIANLEELMPSQKSFGGYIVFRKHHEDLSCGVIVGF
jgi:hypothetical protein